VGTSKEALGQYMMYLPLIAKQAPEYRLFSGSHALAWEPILDAPASCVSKHRRWRVVTAFPRQRVGTRNYLNLAKY
jgi:hypothetical protein